MSEVNYDRESVQPSSVSTPPPLQVPPRKTKVEKVTLREEIQRGWEWVVFVWRTTDRLGGPVEIIRTLYRIAALLIKRTLVQWGWVKK